MSPGLDEYDPLVFMSRLNLRLNRSGRQLPSPSGPPPSPSLPSPSLFFSFSLKSLPPYLCIPFLPRFGFPPSLSPDSLLFLLFLLLLSISIISSVSACLYLHSSLLPIVLIIPACLMVCLFLIYSLHYPSCITSFLSLGAFIHALL